MPLQIFLNQKMFTLLKKLVPLVFKFSVVIHELLMKITKTQTKLKIIKKAITPISHLDRIDRNEQFIKTNLEQVIEPNEKYATTQ